MSLRRAFRIAGAQTVLASHWKVSDKATSRLMTEFIRRWRSGEPRAKAWREAQLSLLHSNEFQNPYFWAAFTLTGQGESGPKVRVLEFVGVEQRQLRFPPGFRAGLAGAPAPDEFRHQPAGSLVAHFPMARQHGLRAGNAEGPPQRHHPLANLHLARPAVAGTQDDQLRPLQIQQRRLQARQ